MSICLPGFDSRLVFFVHSRKSGNAKPGSEQPKTPEFANRKESMEDVSTLAAAVGKIPSGLFIVTTVLNGRKEGYLGSWIQQASFSPLLISMAVRAGRPCYEAIKSHGRFCVNVIGAKNGGVMKPFWNPELSPDPFAGLELEITSRGNVVLKNALAAFECELRSSATPGDHEIIYAEVMDGHLIQLEDKPLTHVRKSALSY
jgi:flavin reductase (DIM6/NTAB) family NADH-FMN oxidoreductase RutF